MLIDRSTIEAELADGETNGIDGSSTEPPTAISKLMVDYWNTRAVRAGTEPNMDRYTVTVDYQVLIMIKIVVVTIKTKNGDKTTTSSKNMPTVPACQSEPVLGFCRPGIKNAR